MSVVNAGLMLSAPSGYTIDRSLRLRSSASAYLSRTPASAGNRKTFTISFWMKRGASLSDNYLFEAYSDNTNRSFIRFGSDSLIFAQTGSANNLVTTQVFRDSSAWYHFVLAVDTTQATSSNRIKVYVNGSQITSFTTAAYPSQNADYQFNNTVAHYLARSGYNGGYGYFDGYLTEINFIDGQALDPTSFGEYDVLTGVWKPAKYTGTYGTNGFYLNFSDGSTTTTLGYDTSGNGNNWTANNISLTAGVTYDSMKDSPTPTAGEVGNYAVLNPLANGNGALSGANLNLTGPTSAWGSRLSTIAITSGKWYFESIPTSGSATQGIMFGITQDAAQSLNIGSTSTSYSYYGFNGQKYNNNAGSAYGATIADNDIVGVAFDADAGSITFYKNGVSQGTAFSSLAAGTWFLGISCYGTATASINFGQRPFAYTPPTGFKSLNTYNLPDSTVADGSDYFNTVLYTGNNTTGHAITGVGFQPDFVWIKDRNEIYAHQLFDSVRGATKALFSNLTNDENTDTEKLQSFDSDGFTYGTNVGGNESPDPYVAWNWKANGAGVSNTDGSITSTVSANTTAGFSIVTYTGTGSVETVGHGLGVAPKMVIIKNRDNAANWHVLTTAVDGSLDVLYLDLTNAKIDAAISSPTSDVFSIGTGNTIGASGYDYVAYCFADVEGYSKFGSYTGNGSADGPFVYTGFRPAFVLVKATSIANQPWYILDSTRDLQNISTNAELYPNSASAEVNLYKELDFLSNGFKVKSTGTGMNSSGNTYIYMALAENPFKNALAR